MAVAPVTPVPALTTTVVSSGVPVNAFGPNPQGGFLTNPAAASDQGIGAAEVLYVNPVGPAGLVANGTTFAIYPGSSWPVIPGQTTPTSVTAATPGHRFSGVSWP